MLDNNNSYEENANINIPDYTSKTMASLSNNGELLAIENNLTL